MYSFTGDGNTDVKQEPLYLEAPGPNSWNEYYETLTSFGNTLEHPHPLACGQDAKEASDKPELELVPQQWQPSIHFFFKKRTREGRPVPTPMQQLLAAVEDPMSPSKVRWLDAKKRRSKIDEKPVIIGHRMEALPGAELILDDVTYYTPGDTGTVEDIDVDEDGNERFSIIWDKTLRSSYCGLAQHMDKPRFKVIGKAEFARGQKVQRRGTGRDWGVGYVTCTNPLLVTVLDSLEARGYEWDEVRHIPEDEEDEDDVVSTPPSHETGNLASPKKTKVPKVSEKKRAESQRLARQAASIRKDASIAYLREIGSTSR
jgi:hypothetical protein